MSIFVNTLTPGLVGISPRTVQLQTSDNLATITTAGYLNRQGQSLQGFAFYPTDIIFTIYSYVASTNSGTFAIFTPSIGSNGQITLVEWVNPGNVLLPVVNGNIPKFDGTNGQLQDSLIAAANLMTLSGTNTLTGSGRIIAVKANGIEASNLVTASGMSGVITTSSLTTAAGASYAITWTNSYIASSNVILLQIMGGTNTNMDVEITVTAGSGTSTLTIFNTAASAALNGTIAIGYLVI